MSTATIKDLEWASVIRCNISQQYLAHLFASTHVAWINAA